MEKFKLSTLNKVLICFLIVFVVGSCLTVYYLISNEKSFSADEIIVKMKSDSNLSIDNVIVYTAETDKNELLGKDGQYTSKINFADANVEQKGEELDPVGGSIEVFENNEDADKRYEYIKEVTSSISALNQHLYLHGKYLLRIDNQLSVDQADEYNKAFAEIVE